MMGPVPGRTKGAAAKSAGVDRTRPGVIPPEGPPGESWAPHRSEVRVRLS